MNSTLKNNQFHLKTEFIKIFNINNNNDWFIYNSIKNKYYIGYGTVEKKSEPGKINNIIDLMKFLIKYYDTELENYLQSFPISSTKIYDTIQINCDIDSHGNRKMWSFESNTYDKSTFEKNKHKH